MEGARLQQEIDNLKDQIKTLNAKIQALVEDTGKILQYEPEKYNLITEKEAEKEMPTVQSY